MKRRNSFLLGAGIGLLLITALFFMDLFWHTPIESPWFWSIFYVLTLPGFLGLEGVDYILGWICFLIQSDLCRGLAFDGGPLVWIEYLALPVGMIGGYGLIALGVNELFLKYNQRRKSRSSPSA